MLPISDEELIEAYERAVEQGLEERFLELLEAELQRRGVSYAKRTKGAEHEG